MTDSDMRELIGAATRSDDDIGDIVLRIGVEQVGAILVDELVTRADLIELADYPAIAVRFDLAFADLTTGHVLKLEKGSATRGQDHDDQPDAVVVQDLADLLRGVFGTSALRTNATRSISWNHLDTPASVQSPPWVFTAVHRLLRGSRAQAHDLGELSLRFGSDKWGLHYYTQHYDRHFAAFADLPLTMLEIGIGGYDDPRRGGGSLSMWKRYFHRAMVYGADLFDKRAMAEQRVGILQGDQANPAFLAELVERTGPLDIVIDDGSHFCPDVITTFRHLFPHLRPGGLYVIEDMQTSYWPDYGGSSDRLSDTATSVGFAKTLIDGLNHEEFEPASARVAADTDRGIVGLHFYHNLLVIEKAQNREGALPAWFPRMPMI